MVIHPTQPSKQEEVPNLKQTVAPSPNYPSKAMKHEDKPVVPSKKIDTMILCEERKKKKN